MAEMTKQFLKKLCKDTDGCYGTPYINDKLYLHYKGFSSITNLEEYVGLKALWLEGNGLQKIEGLEHQTLLKALFLHENILDKIEGLDSQAVLDNINLSKNYIKKIENLSHMKELTSLNLAHNAIVSYEGVEHLLELPTLQTVDLQHNKIDDPAVVDIFAEMPNLRVLYFMGNPAVKKIRNYRKTIISRCKMLKYLDDRPVFDEERRRTDAWAAALAAGGTLEDATEAERAELKAIRAEKDARDEANFRAFEEMVREGKVLRRQKELAAREANGTVVVDGDEDSSTGSTATGDDEASASTTSSSATSAGVIPADDDSGDNVIETTGTAAAAAAAAAPVADINPFSGEQIIPVPESEQLREIREARWGEGSVPFHEKLAAMKLREGKEAAGAAVEGEEDGDDLLRAQEEAENSGGVSNAQLWKDVISETHQAAAAVAKEEEEEEEEEEANGPSVVQPAQQQHQEGEEVLCGKSTSKFMSLLGESAAEVARKVTTISAALPTTTTTGSPAVDENLDMEELD